MSFKVYTVDEYGVRTEYAATDEATEVFDVLTELGVDDSEAMNVFFWAQISCAGEYYEGEGFTVVSL